MSRISVVIIIIITIPRTFQAFNLLLHFLFLSSALQMVVVLG